jgi:uncharacterized membrane protein YkoI
MRKKTMLITGVAAAAVVLGGATVAVAANTLTSDDQPLSGTELQQASDAALATTGGGTVLKAETDDGSYEVDVLRPDGAKVEVEVDRSFQVATVDGPDSDDSEGPALNAADRDQAANAALARVGQGTVSEVERENEGGAAYEVEVRLADGSQVEVQVGADFQVLRQDAPEFDD